MTDELFGPVTDEDVAAEAQIAHAHAAARQLVRAAVRARRARAAKTGGAAQADAFYQLCALAEEALPTDALRRIVSCVIRGAKMPGDFEARRELLAIAAAPDWGWHAYQLAMFLEGVPMRAEIDHAAIDIVRAARTADRETIMTLHKLMSQARGALRVSSEIEVPRAA